MSPKEFAHLVAHGAASELLRLNVQPPEGEAVGVAILECAGVRIVVSLTRYEGPATVHLTPAGAAALGVPARLTNLQKDVLEAAPSRLHNPISAKKLAAVSGYAYSSHFREAVNRLVEHGLLVKLPGGFRKP